MRLLKSVPRQMLFQPCSASAALQVVTHHDSVLKVKLTAAGRYDSYMSSDEERKKSQHNV